MIADGCAAPLRHVSLKGMSIERTAWSWREQRRYLHDIAPYLLASLAVLLAAAFAGYAWTARSTDYLSARREVLGEFVSLFVGLPRPLLALAIFLNNALKTLIVIVAGRLAGLLPVIFLLINGYVLGVVFYTTLHTKGVWSFIVAIVPHGALELPAVLLGTGIGLMLGARAIGHLLKKNTVDLSAEMGRALRFFLAVIVPLLIASALIEAFVTASLTAR